MARFKFQIEGGFMVRGAIRRELNNSKEKMEWKFKGSKVTIREVKDWLSSTFYVSGEDFPDTREFEGIILNWRKQIIKATGQDNFEN